VGPFFNLTTKFFDRHLRQYCDEREERVGALHRACPFAATSFFTAKRIRAARLSVIRQ
jgi:hypothetical protein